MDINQIVAELTAERNRINQAIAALEGSGPRRGRPAGSATGKTGNERSRSQAYIGIYEDQVGAT